MSAACDMCMCMSPFSLLHWLLYPQIVSIYVNIFAMFFCLKKIAKINHSQKGWLHYSICSKEILRKLE